MGRIPEEQLKEAENALKEAPVRVALLRFFSDSYPVDEHELLKLKLPPQNNSGRERYSTGPESESEWEKEIWRWTMMMTMGRRFDEAPPLNEDKSQPLVNGQPFVVSAIKNYFNEYVVQKDGQPKPSSYRVVDRRQIYETKPNFPNPDKRVAYIEDKNGRKKFFGYYVAYQQQFGVVPAGNATPFERSYHWYWNEKPISEDQYIRYYKVHRQLLGFGEDILFEKALERAKIEGEGLVEALRSTIKDAAIAKEQEEEWERLDESLKAVTDGLDQCFVAHTGSTLEQWTERINAVASLPASEYYLEEQQEALKKFNSEFLDEALAQFNRGKLKKPLRPFQFFRERKAKLTPYTPLYNCLYPYLSVLFTEMDKLMEKNGMYEDDLLFYMKIRFPEFNGVQSLLNNALLAPAYRRGLYSRRNQQR